MQPWLKPNGVSVSIHESPLEAGLGPGLPGDASHVHAVGLALFDGDGQGLSAALLACDAEADGRGRDGHGDVDVALAVLVGALKL